MHTVQEMVQDITLLLTL